MEPERAPPAGDDGGRRLLLLGVDKGEDTPESVVGEARSAAAAAMESPESCNGKTC